ncbi:MAG: hypothetical protein NVS3B18_12190 [Candidatus Dormibacteria bacterium]
MPTARERTFDPWDAAEESTATNSASRLAELGWLVAEQRRLEDRERDVVAELVAGGVGWPAVAEALGVSRQAARQRFLRTHDSPAPGA